MNKVIIFVLGLGVIFGAGFFYKQNKLQKISQIEEKVYVAVEGDGFIAVIDPSSKKIVKKISLEINHDGKNLKFLPHNVQVAPDNKSVWVTANLAGDGHSHSSDNSLINKAEAEEKSVHMMEAGEMMKGEMMEHMDEHMGGHSDGHTGDQVIVIDPATDVIIKRISIGEGLHLAHVVLTPDSKYAYATAQVTGIIYKINAGTFEVEKQITTKKGSEPHGLRISPDGKTAYIAILKGKSLGMIDLSDDEFSEISLGGSAVQVGVTSDSKFVVVSLFDTKQLAIYDIKAKTVTNINLPDEAKGPIQMFGTPDSNFMYLADQGNYFGQPNGDTVYKVDLIEKKIVKAIKAGTAPHGVVVDPSGKRVYVTNLVSNDVSIIDTTTDEVTATILVGKAPNGVSYWVK